MSFLSGAGGYWPVVDEVASLSVIQQQDRFSCGLACAEMVLRDLGIDNVTQALIAKNTGTPVRLSDLARTLNQFDITGLRRWVGGGFDLSGAPVTELLATLISTGAWIAELLEPMARLGHLVVVDGWAEDGLLLIRDPWQGTRYKMEQEIFLTYWTWRGIYAISL
ncbi:papain-like cysteine protease family protein [Gloeocapsa sp. PCC 73106]|uniref:C39 family peptidase n=1 Tax=Gloeocapsa sp. PCC 73106 TaxID=102232 RepID=UPI0002AD0434|nr:papain-like cysteine protease family protein [Gloeocapsa sp. PCC 73106]ELR96540.1 Papain-like cysteine protease AvrRpt2 [Gloeocapsa sp. PCC 73106]